MYVGDFLSPACLNNGQNQFADGVETDDWQSLSMAIGQSLSAANNWNTGAPCDWIQPLTSDNDRSFPLASGWNPLAGLPTHSGEW